MAKNVQFIQKHFRKSVHTCIQTYDVPKIITIFQKIFHIFGVGKRQIFKMLIHNFFPPNKSQNKKMTQVKWCDAQKYLVKFGHTDRSITFSPRPKFSITIFKHCSFLWPKMWDLFKNVLENPSIHTNLWCSENTCNFPKAFQIFFTFLGFGNATFFKY